MGGYGDLKTAECFFTCSPKPPVKAHVLGWKGLQVLAVLHETLGLRFLGMPELKGSQPRPSFILPQTAA